MHLNSVSEKRKKLATILTFLSLPLSGFVTDIYLPSFPSMARNLEVPKESIQLTLTYFFLSYGIGQLFVGSILDSIGRRKPVLLSLLVIAASSALIAYATHVELIYLLRILQGIATAVLMVAKRAYFIDIYEGEERKHYLSYLTIIWFCGPILAPFLGGYLEQLFGWESNFFFLAGYATLLLFAEYIWSGETIRAYQPFKLKETLQIYGTMLKNAPFITGIIIIGLAYSVAVVFNIAGPFVIEHHFKYNSVVIGYCTLLLGISWMIGGIISKKLLASAFAPKISAASGIQIALLLFLVGVGYYYDNIFVLVGFAFLIHICSGFLFTNFFTNNLVFFPNNAGIASGLVGGLLYIIISIGSLIVSISGTIATTLDMSLRYAIFAIPMALIIYKLLYASNPKKVVKVT